MSAATTQERFQQLNEPQARAARHASGPLLIFAGAGSGKTRTITYRVAHLLAEHRVPPYRLLAVTFTNKAAGEMKERLENLVGSDIIRDVWVGTFHATCARLLRRYHAEVGLERQFSIYDESDQKAVLARIMKARGVDERALPVKLVLSRIHAQKQNGCLPNQVQLSRTFDTLHLDLYEQYQRALRAANAVDFEDLLLLAMQLAEGSGVGEEIRSRFDHVLVDEFQDTNVTQYRLLRALSGQTRNLAVVGDDDQSIYRWRGADVRIIRGFRKDFPDATVIKLEQNYRSSGNIVAAGLGVIGPSREREPKRLWTDAPAGRPVQIVAVTDEREEASFVVRSVQRLLAEGVDPRQIGIFYRIHAQSRVLEEAFRSVRIPYQIIGGMRFFERAEVKDVLAYLRLVDNPRSDADLLRIVNVPSRGIGDTTVKRLLDVSAERGSSVYEAIPAAVASGRLGSAAQRKLLAFSSMIGQLIERATTLGAHELAREVLDRTGYRQALRNDDSAESDARLENIAELLGSIAEYESEALHSGLEPSVGGYLERTALFTATDGLKDAPSVALMTVHAAKGLEFDTVLLSGMEEEIFPYQRMGSETVEELDEERRLAYVAVTRARRLLIITHAAVRTLFGMTRYRDPSRFLDDIPTEVADRQGSPYAQAERHFSRLSCRDRYDDAAAGDTDQRTIDPTFADPLPTDEPGVVVRAGDRVRHRRFGEGIVQRVEVRSGLTVVARFPGFGEKRILAEYLELG